MKNHIRKIQEKPSGGWQPPTPHPSLVRPRLRIVRTKIACVAGVNGEGEGEQERGRRGTGARDEGTPATKTPIFSFLRPPAAAKF